MSDWIDDFKETIGQKRYLKFIIDMSTYYYCYSFEISAIDLSQAYEEAKDYIRDNEDGLYEYDGTLGRDYIKLESTGLLGEANAFSFECIEIMEI
jgi:hypothetical protein